VGGVGGRRAAGLPPPTLVLRSAPPAIPKTTRLVASVVKHLATGPDVSLVLGSEGIDNDVDNMT
jgi:hypothetical protein